MLPGWGMLLRELGGATALKGLEEADLEPPRAPSAPGPSPGSPLLQTAAMHMADDLLQRMSVYWELAQERGVKDAGDAADPEGPAALDAFVQLHAVLADIAAGPDGANPVAGMSDTGDNEDAGSQAAADPPPLRRRRGLLREEERDAEGGGPGGAVGGDGSGAGTEQLDRPGRRLSQVGGSNLNYQQAFRLVFGNFFDLAGGGEPRSRLASCPVAPKLLICRKLACLYAPPGATLARWLARAQGGDPPLCPPAQAYASSPRWPPTPASCCCS
jgi:hypothetical protein